MLVLSALVFSVLLLHKLQKGIVILRMSASLIQFKHTYLVASYAKTFGPKIQKRNPYLKGPRKTRL